ncbi:unnamed protein product [Penicillium olsonii]|uniref:Ankyrin repeat protein n=1 Tax=Penicillium olsonii TaxID=99116 RepID=A0A9W4I107_PENOL|nr:unnamed protein product [Penicillium olsonii]
MTRLLLERGADPLHHDRNGLTALHWAALERTGAVAQLIIQKAAPNLEKIDENGLSALHHAAYWGNRRMVSRLLKMGCDPNRRSHAGWCPIHQAVHGGHLEIIDLLLDRGADVNASEHIGIPPLRLALTMGNQVIIDRLLEAGA